MSERKVVITTFSEERNFTFPHQGTGLVEMSMRKGVPEKDCLL